MAFKPGESEKEASPEELALNATPGNFNIEPPHHVKLPWAFGLKGALPRLNDRYKSI